MDNSNNTPLGTGPAATVTSGMLTVWRRLHIEVDSMGTVGGNSKSGNMTVPATPPGATQVTITTDQTLDPGDAGRFVPGTLMDSAGNRFTAVSHTTGANFTVTLNLPAGGAVPVNGIFSLRDDDVLTNGTRLGLPDTSTLTTAMAAAYVTPILQDVGTNNPNVTFVVNVENGSNPDQFYGIVSSNWESRGLNAPDFWVAYLLEAFQGPKASDGDPDTESFVMGQTGAAGSNNSGGGSLIYKEVINDASSQPGSVMSTAQLEQDTVVHELGHAVGDAAETVTEWNHSLSSSAGLSIYNQDTLNRIRSATNPQS